MKEKPKVCLHKHLWMQIRLCQGRKSVTTLYHLLQHFTLQVLGGIQVPFTLPWIVQKKLQVNDPSATKEPMETPLFPTLLFYTR